MPWASYDYLIERYQIRVPVVAMCGNGVTKGLVRSLHFNFPGGICSSNAWNLTSVTAQLYVMSIAAAVMVLC